VLDFDADFEVFLAGDFDSSPLDLRDLGAPIATAGARPAAIAA
jgi:hypothetical protein